MSVDDVARSALLRLLRLLKQGGYAFVTPTPATHARVLARPDRRRARSVEDVLGWSLPFVAGVLPHEIELCLRDAGAIAATPAGEVSRLRVSSLGGDLYLHSAYPTEGEDAVFFGPDSYRFAALVSRDLTIEPPAAGARIVDIGTGTGVAAISAARLCPEAAVTMTDVNRQALALAMINAEAAGVAIQAIATPDLKGVDGAFDIVTINPPYIIDDGARIYRDGGGMRGAELSLRLTSAALRRLAPGGRILLYTGSAIIGGVDALRNALIALAQESGADIGYAELDPDVFGEELTRPQYRDVDRIALISATLRRHGGRTAQQPG